MAVVRRVGTRAWEHPSAQHSHCLGMGLEGLSPGPLVLQAAARGTLVYLEQDDQGKKHRAVGLQEERSAPRVWAHRREQQERHPAVGGGHYHGATWQSVLWCGAAAGAPSLPIPL